MFTANEQLLLLLNSFLNNTPSKLIIEPTDTQSWKKLMQLANIHNVIPMVYDALSRVENKEALDEAMLRAYRQLSISKVGVCVSREAEFLRVYSHLKNSGVYPAVIKGSALAVLYEKKGCRLSSDEDILIDANELEVLKKSLKEIDYELVDVTEKESVYHFHNAKTNLMIEAHIRLFMDDAATKRHYRLFENGIEFAQRGEFKVLNENFELLYLICHAAKHFALSGFGIRQLCDIIILTKTHWSTLDFDWLLKKTGEAELQTFAASLFKAGERYLGLENVPPPFKKYVADVEPLIEDIMEGGVFGKSTSARERSVRITLNAVSDSSENPVVKSLFPPFDEMVKIYPKLEKRKLLLPVYWVMRLFKWAFTQKEKSLDTIKKGAERTKLLKRYGLGKEQ